MIDEVHTCEQLMSLIEAVGFLPLLNSGIPGYSAEEIVDEDCRYSTDPSDGFYWPLWQWKGTIVNELPCVYGKFFDKKAGFISMDWWPDFVNYRRSRYPRPEEGTIESTILDTLQLGGSQVTRDLRAACGFSGQGMRGKFDSFVTRLQMGTYIVTENFVYPRDKHNREYGWGLSLLTTPEELYGREAFRCERTPEESLRRMQEHMHSVLPEATDKQIKKLIG